MTVSHRSRLTVVGENGKTTLLHVLAGCSFPTRAPSRVGTIGSARQELGAPPGATVGTLTDAALRGSLTAPAALEERLRAKLVHGLRPQVVELSEYDPQWLAHFERHRAALEGVLASRARFVEHIGSTAVPGLAATPIIDIVVGLDRRPLSPSAAVRRGSGRPSLGRPVAAELCAAEVMVLDQVEV